MASEIEALVKEASKKANTKWCNTSLYTYIMSFQCVNICPHTCLCSFILDLCSNRKTYLYHNITSSNACTMQARLTQYIPHLQ